VVPGYDAILLSCKAYDLDDAIDAIRPAVAGAVVIPLLNGMRHLDRLDTAFGKEAVGGGVAALFVAMEPDGLIRHVGQTQNFVFGERHPAQAERCAGAGAHPRRLRAPAQPRDRAGHVGKVRVHLHRHGGLLPHARRRRRGGAHQ
jgi:ketopantoate reductase